MKQIFHMIEDVAPSTASILILGETGTGKEPWQTLFIVKATGHVCLCRFALRRAVGRVYWKASFWPRKGAFDGRHSGQKREV